MLFGYLLKALVKDVGKNCNLLKALVKPLKPLGKLFTICSLATGFLPFNAKPTVRFYVASWNLHLSASNFVEITRRQM